jgi:hypothetical protein
LSHDKAQHFEQRQYNNESVITCAKASAPALIAAIADVAGVSIEQIAAAMGVQAPQAQAWIPTSERLPSEDGKYLVQWDDGDRNTWSYHPELQNHSWRNGSIVAWQPLPDAWKAGA